LGEVRGIEARTLLDSFNTGHSGSLATIHANSAEKALHRFANLVMRNHAQTTFSDTEAEIGEAVDFVVHVERQPGRRIIREILAVRGYDRDFQDFLKTPQAKQVASTLRVRKGPNKDAKDEAQHPGKKLGAGVESTASVRVMKA